MNTLIELADAYADAPQYLPLSDVTTNRRDARAALVAGIEELQKDAFTYKVSWERVSDMAKDVASDLEEARKESDDLRAELDALKSQEKIPTWQPIETAPKDGRDIIVYFKTAGIRQVSWCDEYGDPSGEYALWRVDDNKHGPYALRGYRPGDDTHWMPLPTPPESQ